MILFISNTWSCFFRQKFVIPTFGSSVNFIFFLFQPHRNRGVKDGYQILSWDKSQTQVIPSLSTIISYLQRSNVPWCPTLVLLSQTCFLLLLSGSYGYDRSCWFQAKMIINIRNELPSSCLGSLHQNDLCPWMIECTKWHIHDKIKDQFQ